MTKVLIHTRAPQRHIARLTEAHPEVIFDGCNSFEKLPDTLARFAPDVLFSVNFTTNEPYPRDAVLSSGIKWVSTGGSGTDHFAPWNTEDITVTNAAGVAASMMVEYVLGCAIHFNIDVPGLTTDKISRTWQSDRNVRSLSSQTLLIVGLGHTGRLLAERAKAFGMTVIGTRANPRTTPYCDEVHSSESLPQLWPRADVIAVCTPRLPSTLGLIGRTAFALMKPDVVLINVSRGGVVDEAALIEALSQNRLRGAAMDVFGTEPLPADDPIWEAPNLLISPHCSAVFDGWEDTSITMFSDNLGRYLAGETLSNVVDPIRGY
ncbi:MAG: D-2-hydroxyacid dehydrogenase [Aliishimia sp.]